MADNIQETQCCPQFDPSPWDDKIFTWENKKFIKGKVRTFFYIPLNFGKIIRNLFNKIVKADALSQESLCLSEHKSKWTMNIFLAVPKEIPNAENVELSGKFLSKVYEGSFKETGRWFKDFEEFAKIKGEEIKKMYMWYTTCPKCAKKYGKNYVVIIAEV